MEQKVRNLFIDTPFSTEGLNVQGFSIIEVSKGKVKKGKLLSTADFSVDALMRMINEFDAFYQKTYVARFAPPRDARSVSCQDSLLQSCSWCG